MADRPFLLFPRPIEGRRIKKKTGFAVTPRPSYSKQRQIGPQFRALETALKKKKAELQSQVAGAIPEQVIVLETVGTVSEFVRAVGKIAGLEWLVELEDESEPDESLFDDDLEEDIPSGRLFLVMANQAAMDELVRLWRTYRKDRKTPFPYGLGRFREVFEQLKTVRTWNASDRVQYIDLDAFIMDRIDPNERVSIEAELWYRADEGTRNRASREIRHLVDEAGGRILSDVVIGEIRYHGILAELPLAAVRKMVGHQDTRLVLCDDVMFFRPAPQFVVWTPDKEPSIIEKGLQPRQASGEPIVAILDGLPVANHAVLVGHLIVDDPDDWAKSYPVESRRHGTMVASLVLRGDLHDSASPLAQPIYVRPVLLPVGSMGGSFMERMPADQLPVDVVHRAVRRMFDGEGGSPPSAPSVRVINFAIGDPARHFAADTSPLARLLDWLSWRYGVLFVVSAGNHSSDFTLGVSRTSFRSLNEIDRQKEIIRAIAMEAPNRRLLSPAEAVNALTVGASHADRGPSSGAANVWNPYVQDGCASPISALGKGYNRSVKPEILVDGGRLHFRESPATSAKAKIEGVVTTGAPGQLAAMPAPMGELRAVGNFVGSSNAAALATRAASLVYSNLEALRAGGKAPLLYPQCNAPLMKAALVHSASWGDSRQMLKEALNGVYDSHQIRDMIARMLGYGRIDLTRALTATDERATLVGCGLIGAEQSHTFRVPLPPGIAGKKIWRRLSVTLAWITPLNFASNAYRRARLFFEPLGSELRVDRIDADWQSVRRGTVQHEILEGDKATAFSDGDFLSLVVNCKSDPSVLKEKVPYGIFASLEVGQGVGIPVYDEVLARIREPLPVTPRVRSR